MSKLTSNYEFGEKFSMKDNKLQNIPKFICLKISLSSSTIHSGGCQHFSICIKSNTERCIMKLLGENIFISHSIIKSQQSWALIGNRRESELNLKANESFNSFSIGIDGPRINYHPSMSIYLNVWIRLFVLMLQKRCHFPHFRFILLSIKVSFVQSPISHPTNHYNLFLYILLFLVKLPPTLIIYVQLQYFNEKSCKSNFYLVGEMKSLTTWGFHKERKIERIAKSARSTGNAKRNQNEYTLMEEEKNGEKAHN